MERQVLASVLLLGGCTILLGALGFAMDGHIGGWTMLGLGLAGGIMMYKGYSLASRIGVL